MRRSDHETMALTARSFLLRLAMTTAIVVACGLLSRAGGPKLVAGSSYFDSTMNGQPLLWPQGLITYYTDQGDLSPILPNASANSFVAGAFSQWTSVSTAAITATSGGQLAEDVNGTNVYVNADGTISMPADIQSTATGTPVGVVYDADGSVTDALLGAGAGDSGQCFFNAVTGGNDNYGSLATYQHALIVINGQCAQLSSQLTDVEYRLVRVIGEVLGLGWSQLNLNVQTGSPPPTSDDYAGFPVMHFADSWNCVPITVCYPNPYQLSMDDGTALSRLYPVTVQNQSSFPGKQVFSSVTARIQGSVWFTDTHGNRTQPMQGVNVVARWINPATGLPSRRYAASSVSGFLFTGNAGNPVTGYTDATGDPFSEWGSNNQTVEGFFDLAGLQLPNGGSTQYQLSVEAVDPFWSPGVGPYSPGPVSPSGSAQTIIVTLAAGSDVAQDILMNSTAQPVAQASSSWTAPAALPSGGDWISSLNSYGNVPYFLLPAQANRTLSVAVTALDESGNASEVKTQPLIGMWAASDPQGTMPPTSTTWPFNQTIYGMTRLDTQVLATGNYLIGIADLRGDGRPDYRFHAHVLYADTISPSRVGVTGGAVTILGTGFAQGFTSTVGTVAATQLSINASQIILSAPPFSDGTQNVTIIDPVSGASTTMTGALTFGAAATDNIVLLYGLQSPDAGWSAGGAPRERARPRGRWSHARKRCDHRLERHQFRAAFCLRGRFVVLGDHRSERRRSELADTYADWSRHDHCDSGPRRLCLLEIGQCHALRYRNVVRHRDRLPLCLDFAGSDHQRPADRTTAEQRRGEKQRASELHAGQRIGHSKRGQRKNKSQRLCHVESDGDAIFGPGTSNGVRGPGERSVRDVLCQPRSAGATES
jgi:hypothetical protein